MGLLVALVLLAGCVSPPAPPQAAVIMEEAKAPAPALIEPAPVNVSAPILTSPLGPGDEFGFNQSGLRALNVSVGGPWTLKEFGLGHHDQPVFLVVAPIPRPPFDLCGPVPASIRWHSFITDQGNLLGHAFPAGDYMVLLYSERLSNLTLRLGADPNRTYRPMDSYAPPIGLQVLQAEVELDSIAFPYRVRFEHQVDSGGRTLFLSEFRMRSNAHSGREVMTSYLRDGGGNDCARDERTREDVSGITGLDSNFATVIGDGVHTWSGTFESHATANPRLDAMAYALRFVD